MVDSKVNEAIKEKRRSFKTYSNLKNLTLYEKAYKMLKSHTKLSRSLPSKISGMPRRKLVCQS